MKELQWVQIINGEIVTEKSLRNKRAQNYINYVARRRRNAQRLRSTALLTLSVIILVALV